MDQPIEGCEKFRDDLALLALGTLSGRRRAEVIDHLEGCVECAAELEGLSVCRGRRFSSSLGERRRPPGFDERTMAAMSAGRERRRFSARVAALAAAAMLVVGFGIGALVHNPKRSRPDLLLRRRSPPRPAPRATSSCPWAATRGCS